MGGGGQCQSWLAGKLGGFVGTVGALCTSFIRFSLCGRTPVFGFLKRIFWWSSEMSCTSAGCFCQCSFHCALWRDTESLYRRPAPSMTINFEQPRSFVSFSMSDVCIKLLPHHGMPLLCRYLLACRRITSR